MKILFINNFFSLVGGTERVMWDQASLMKEQGHEVHFFATNKKPFFIPDYENAHFFPEYVDPRQHSGLSQVFRLPNIFSNHHARKKLEAYLEALKPDIIHIHNLHYHLTPAILSACAKAGSPIVMTLHDNRLLCPSASYIDSPQFKGLCNTGNPFICLKSKCKNKNFSETAISILDFYLNKKNITSAYIERFILPSNTLLELMKKAGLPEEKLLHIHNPINAAFSNQSSSEDKGYFIYVGRLSREKGVHFLLEALKTLPHIPLKIVGVGPQEAELRTLAASLQLHNVEFLGFQPVEEVISLLKKARASVLPCNWFETFGMSLVESLMLGKAVIASNIGAIPEVLDHGRCGILIPPADIQALSSALEDLYEHPEKAINLGKAGQKRVESIYSSASHLEKTVSLYDELLNSRQNLHNSLYATQK
jgi:glycosyltransferase involved in cell wall biosynthesis